MIVRIKDNADRSALSQHDARISPTEGDRTLQEIVQQARLATTATGAAIVLASAGERICLAKSGATAGEVVNYLNAHSAILHACLRTGEAQVCDDAEADARFDLAMCRRLGLRSVLIVPIQSENLLRGVIEIFSPRPNAFCDRDVLMLQGLADRVAASVNIDLAKIVATPAIAKDVPDKPVSPSPVPPRPGAHASRLQRKGRIPAAPPIHWTLLVTVVGLPLLMGWMLGAAAAGPAHGPTQVKSAITVPPASLVAPPVAPSRDPLPAEKTSQDADAATNRSDASALPVLSSPVLILEDVANALVLQRVEPEYPSEARDRRIQGTVVMKVIVGKDGSVERVSRIAGDSQLALATATAMRQWRFKPLLRNGLPTGFESHITLDFALP